jgi:hypothetical protein
MLSALCGHSQRPRLLLLEHSVPRNILLPSKKPVYQQYKKSLCRSARRSVWRQQTARLLRCPSPLAPQDMTTFVTHWSDLSNDMPSLMAMSLSRKAGRHATFHAQEQPVRILPDSLNGFQPDDVSCSRCQQESYRLSDISGRSGLAGDCICVLTDAMGERGAHSREKLEFSGY